ncbi:MAG: VTT domain-containing protein [Gammaproteobacteria bacterium]|nr:VTT domain-containing protein [Gammaproteobacteria bacterium]
MTDSISPVLQWLNAHPNLSGLAAFVISAGESIAIIGTIIPGTVVMAAVGTLMGAGVIPLWSTIIWAIMGAIAGDNLSYWIGRHYKNKLHAVWPFRNYPQLLQTGERFFHKHGSKSILIGRFIGPVRALVPLVAGMLSMKPMRFIPSSIIASMLWAPAYLLPGILLGQATIEMPPDIAAHMMLVLVMTALLILICVWSVYKILILVGYRINRLLNRIWQSLQGSRYFHSITTLLKHYDHSKTHGQLTLAFYFLMTSIGFITLASYIHTHGSDTIATNQALFHLFRSLRTPMIDNIMFWFTLLGDKKVLIPTMLILFSWLAWKKSWHTAWHTLGLLFLICASIFTIKIFIHSARPWGIVAGPETFSFPSGHTTFSTCFYFALGLAFIQLAQARFKRTIIFLVLLTVVAISVSRLYLGAHWFTDVLGGWLLGASLVMLVTLSYNRKQEKHPHPYTLVFIALGTVLLISSSVYYLSYNKLKMNYAQTNWPTYTMTEDMWWTQKDYHIPHYRIGRLGLPTELFNLQWLEELNKIQTTLQSQGWVAPTENKWTDVLHRLTDVNSAEHLPLLSPLYLDKKPVLVLIKQINNKKIIVLRLWNSNVFIQNKPLWIGSVGVVPRTYSWLITYKKNNAITLLPNIIFSTPSPQVDIKAIEFINKLKHKSQIQQIILIKPKNIS